MTSIGYTVREFDGIAVPAPGTASVDAVMEERAARLEEISVRVVSKAVPGVDLSSAGLVQSNTVTREFNNIFSGALLTLVDYCRAAVPSLQVNVPTFLPIVNEDIAHVELARVWSGQLGVE